MKNNIVFHKTLFTRLLIITSLLSFNCAIFAEEYVSEVKISKDIQAPKVTHTHKNNVHVTTTVKVEGTDKKTTQEVKNSVVKVIKKAMARWEKTAGYKVVKPKPTHKKAVHAKKKKHKHFAKKSVKKVAKSKKYEKKATNPKRFPVLNS